MLISGFLLCLVVLEVFAWVDPVAAQDPPSLIDPGREPEMEYARRNSPISAATAVSCLLGAALIFGLAWRRARSSRSPAALLTLGGCLLSLFLVEVYLLATQDDWRQHIKLRDGCYHDNPRGYFERSTFYNDESIWAWCTDRLSETWKGCESPSKEKSEHEQRILTLGDSFTDGVGVFRRDLWPARLSHYLPGANLSTVNCAKASAFTSHVAKRFLAHGLAHEPDIVLYAFVLNDVVPPNVELVDGRDIAFQLPDADAYRERLGFVPLFGPMVARSAIALWMSERLATRRIHHETIEMYRATYRDLERPEVQEAFALIEAMDAIADKRGMRFAVVLWPLFESLDAYPFLDEHRRIKAELTQRGLSTIDLLPLFEGESESELHVHPTDHHPNELAHDRAARHIAEVMVGRGWVTVGQ